MSTRITIIDRIITAVAILVQTIDGFGVKVIGSIGGDEAAPCRAVISGVAVVQAGIFVVVVATVADGVGLCYSNIGSLTGNSTVTMQ